MYEQYISQKWTEFHRRNGAFGAFSYKHLTINLKDIHNKFE